MSVPPKLQKQSPQKIHGSCSVSKHFSCDGSSLINLIRYLSACRDMLYLKDFHQFLCFTWWYVKQRSEFRVTYVRQAKQNNYCHAEGSVYVPYRNFEDVLHNFFPCTPVSFMIFIGGSVWVFPVVCCHKLHLFREKLKTSYLSSYQF